MHGHKNKTPLKELRDAAMSAFSTEKPIRVLHVLDKLAPDSGVAAVVMRYLEAVDANKVVFDVLVHEEPEEEIKKQLQRKGSRFYTAPRLKLSNMFSYLQFLHHFFKEHSVYKTVHGHMPNAAVFYLGMARLGGVPVRILHSHNTASADGLFRRLRNSFLFLFIPWCANVHCACSMAAAKFLFRTQKGRLTQPCYLARNAIQLEKYAFSPERRELMRMQLEIRKDQLVVGHIGRFCKQKNHAFLLDVFVQIHKRNPRALLMLIGDGELREKILRKADLLGLKNSILYLGVRRDVAELLQAMDIFVLPSFYEGLPMVAVEAQASGLPCVFSSDVTREAALLSTSACFIDIDEGPEVWARAILSHGGEKRHSSLSILSKAGYDIHNEAERLTHFYKNLDTLVQNGEDVNIKGGFL